MDEARKGGSGEQIRTAEQKLHAAVLADPRPAGDRGPQGDPQHRARSELDHRVEMMQKVAQILTPAQKQQLLTMRRRPHGRGPAGASAGGELAAM
jgi:hypothetical protein